ncbi:optomotor-blind protein-like, partial [Penaeus japonicus]
MEFEQESLDCPVCLEEYDSSKHLPKMMPCLHTVCASCVLDLIRSRNLHKSPTMMTTSEPIIAPNRSNTQGINTNHMNTNTNHMNTNTNYMYTNTNYMNTNTNHMNTNTNYMYTNNNTAAINTLATLMQRHPPLRRLSEQGRPPPVNIVRREPSAAPPQGVFLKAPASRTRPCVSPPAPPVASYVASPVASFVASPVGSPLSSPVGSPVSPPTAPPPVMTKPQAKELVIPKDLGVQCPLCRVVINTSSLQTNRYVMAHMKDLARLQRASSSGVSHSALCSSAAESEFLPENFWCLACASPAKSACRGHDVSPLQHS